MPEAAVRATVSQLGIAADGLVMGSSFMNQTQVRGVDPTFSLQAP